jgi:hypothetical protein
LQSKTKAKCEVRCVPKFHWTELFLYIFSSEPTAEIGSSAKEVETEEPKNLCQNNTKSSTGVGQINSHLPELSRPKQLPDRNEVSSFERDKDPAGSQKNRNDSKIDPRTDQTSVPKTKPSLADPGPVSETGNDNLSILEPYLEDSDDFVEIKFSITLNENQKAQNSDQTGSQKVDSVAETPKSREEQIAGSSGVSSNVDQNSGNESEKTSLYRRYAVIRLHKLTPDKIKKWTEPKAARKRGLLPGCKGGPCQKKNKLSDAEEPSNLAENSIIATNSENVVEAKQKKIKKIRNVFAYLPQNLTCLICDKTFSNHREVFTHQASIHFGDSLIEMYDLNLKEPACPICSLKLVKISDLLRHMAMNHGVLEESDLKVRIIGIVPNQAPTFSCQLCSKQYINQVSFF